MNAKAYLIKEGNGIWYAKHQNTDEQWTKRSLHTRKKAQARIAFGEFLKELEQGATLRAAPIPLERAKDDYLRWVQANRARSWYTKQKQYFDSTITPFFGAQSYIRTITHRRVESYAESRKAQVKATTVNKELAAIRKFCRKLVEWGELPVNPTARVRDLPDDIKPRVRYLTVPEYELLRAHAEAMKRSPSFASGKHFRFLTEYLMLGCNTGLRPNELLHLEARDIELSTRRLRVRRKPDLGFHPKSYHEREVPLNEHAFAAACSLLALKHPSSDFLFHHADGKRVVSIRESFSTLVSKAALEDVTPYTLRHTFGAWGVKAGVPIRMVQKLMGHSTVAVTERYSHVAQDDLDAAVNRLNGILPSLMPNPIVTPGLHERKLASNA